jgi:microcystin-dependent protein
MANYEATKYNFNGSNLTNIQGVNTGIVVPWGTASVPSGFLACDGSAVSRTTYSALFAVVGTTYGVGDGTTTFNVPNLAGRTVISKSNNQSLASTGGANCITPTGNISGATANTTLTVNQIPSHTHTWAVGGGCTGNSVAASASCRNASPATGSAGGGQAHSHNLSANFVGSAGSSLPPYLILQYIIKT